MRRGTKRLIFVLFLRVTLSLGADSVNERLIAAARTGDLSAVKRLVEEGADVNAKTTHGVSALCFAAGNGHADVVTFLLNRGADLNHKDPVYGMDALGWAAYRDRVSLVKMLLPKMPPGRAAGVLTVAVSKQNLELAQAALDAGGINPEELSFALGEALHLGATDIAEALKKAGAVPPLRADFTVKTATLQKYAGLYRNEKMDIDLRLTLTKGVLSGVLSSQEAFTLGALDETTFRPREREGITLTFEVENGKTTGCTWKNARRRSTISFKKADEN